MSLITINDVSVIGGSVSMPKVGVWTADLVIDQIDGSGFGDGTQVTISADGGVSLSGVVAPARTGDFLDAVHVRVLGGAGGMAKPSTARSFVQPGAFVRDILSSISSDSGETLDSTIDSKFTGSNLTAWATMSKSCSWNLRALLQFVAPTYSWRITSAGNLWMGVETWPAASGGFDIIGQNPSDGTYTLGCDSPFFSPGSSLANVGNVATVEHKIEKNQVRSVVSIDLPEGDRGIMASIARLVQANTAGIDYYAFYRARVNSQSGDGKTLDVTPDDARLSGFQRVALRHGLPATKVQVAPGGFVLIGFMGGDPRLPFVHSWEGGETLLSAELGSGTDNVLTKADMTALITSITTMASTGNSGGPLSFTAPPTYASNTIKVAR